MYDSQTFKSYWPFIRYMQLSGLFYVDCSALNNSDSFECKKTFFKCAFWKVVATSLLIINWTSTLSIFLATAVFFFRGVMTFSEIVKMSCISLWLFQNSINDSTCYYLCWSNRLHKSYFEKWDQLHSYTCTNARLVRNVIIYVCIFVNVFNTVGWFMVAFDFYPDLYQNFFPVLKFFDPPMARTFQMLWGVAGILSTPCWSLPVGLFVLMSLNIIILFQNYNKELEEQFDKYDGKIETYRLHYQRLIEIVESADGYFGAFVFSLFIANLVIMSLIMYRMVYYADTYFSKTIDIFWFVCQFLVLSVVSCVSAWVNVVAHQSLDKLYSVSTDQMSPKEILQLSLFISRLKDGSIGYTGCGFFLITKGFLITLVSAFFTYFFLLQQFGTVTSTLSSNASNAANISYLIDV